MGAGHGHRLHYHGHSALHRAEPQHKLAGMVAFMLLVVGTPGGLPWAFPSYLLVVIAAVAIARVPWRYLLPRMVVELPILGFALLLPLVAGGPRVELIGLALSRPGLEAAGLLLAKATLGVLAALLLAATTEPVEVIAGLERLRVPTQLVQIAAFMVRYLEVVSGELSRMLVAMRARGCSPGSPRHWPMLARTLGALFVRSYERGERVHLAMLSRGYDGTLPRGVLAPVHDRHEAGAEATTDTSVAGRGVAA